MISQLAVALNQGVFEEIQVLRRQAKKPRVQASWFYWFYWWVGGWWLRKKPKQAVAELGQTQVIDKVVVKVRR